MLLLGKGKAREGRSLQGQRGSKVTKAQSAGQEDVADRAVMGGDMENYVSGALNTLYISSALIVTVP